jgi:hypothetical protein
MLGNRRRAAARAALAVASVAVALGGSAAAQAPAAAKAAPEWSFRATIIEACSCPMFCQCYFNEEPAAGGGHEGHGGGAAHFCRFNNAFRVDRGSYGTVQLDGLEFWVAGDLGGDFRPKADGSIHMGWAELTFEPTATKEQRDAIAAILGHLYPVKWESFTIAKDAPIEWSHDAKKAVAKLDGGKAGEVVLKSGFGMTEAPVVIQNLRYWGAPRNDGFVLMKNEVEAYRVGTKPFEFKGTNGFMITVEIASKDVAT